MNDGKIHIPAKKMVPNKQGCIKITYEALELLAEVVNESGGSAKTGSIRNYYPSN